MEYVCPVCEETGNIPEKNLEHPLTKRSCRNCGAILLINPENGNIDAHKAPLKDSRHLKSSNTHAIEKFESALSDGLQDAVSRDWPAILVVGVILFILFAAGIYSVLNPDFI